MARRIAGGLLGAVVGVILGFVLLTQGPETFVVCDGGTLLQRIGQDVKDVVGFGQIDGESATYCYTPETVTWILAAGTVLLAITVGVVLGGRSRTVG